MTEEAENPVVRAHRDVVERLWTEPVLELADSDLPVIEEATVLAAEVRCGKMVDHWLQSLPPSTRMMALEPSGPMLDEARSRVDDEEKKRLFFVEERVNSLSYTDDVFDAGVCLHGIVTTRQASEGLAELQRVISAGSPLIACVPLQTSFPEFYDLFDEALRACELEDVLPRLDDLRGNLLTPARIFDLAQQLGLEELEISELQWDVAFGGGREYLYSPLIQETFFPHWIGAVRSDEREKVISHIGEAIDTYWADETLQTQVCAALVVGTKGEQGQQ